MTLRLTLLALFAFTQVPALACDEECAAGFYFDDARATCVRLPIS